jgi:hypothetical protein
VFTWNSIVGASIEGHTKARAMRVVQAVESNSAREAIPLGSPIVEESVVYLRESYHFGSHKIAMYLKRYHEFQISPSEIRRILKRLDMSRLPASQRYRRRTLSGHPLTRPSTPRGDIFTANDGSDPLHRGGQLPPRGGFARTMPETDSSPKGSM